MLKKPKPRFDKRAPAVLRVVRFAPSTTPCTEQNELIINCCVLVRLYFIQIQVDYKVNNDSACPSQYTCSKHFVVVFLHGDSFQFACTLLSFVLTIYYIICPLVSVRKSANISFSPQLWRVMAERLRTLDSQDL